MFDYEIAVAVRWLRWQKIVDLDDLTMLKKKRHEDKFLA